MKIQNNYSEKQVLANCIIAVKYIGGKMSDSTNESRPPPNRNYEALKLHIITHKIDCGLWALRVAAVLFAFLYFIPLFG